jgi:hypothetical protein
MHVSGKADSSSWAEIKDKIMEPIDANADAEVAAAAAPSDPLLAHNAAETAKVCANLVEIAKRAEITKASLPDLLRLVTTHAAHIFSKSTNTGLCDEKKSILRYSEHGRILFSYVTFCLPEGLRIWYVGCDGTVRATRIYGLTKNTSLG